MNWRIMWAIAQKDITDAMKNLFILFALLLPIGMSIMLRPMMGGYGNGNDEITLNIAVYDPEGSRLVAGLQNLPQVKLVETSSEQQMLDSIQVRVIGGISVPPGFDAAIDAGQQPDLPVFVNGQAGGGGIAAFRQLIQQQLWSLVDRQPPVNIEWKEASSMVMPSLQMVNNTNAFLLNMMLIIGLTLTGAFVVPTLLVEEKEKHTLNVLLVSPGSLAEVVLGKALTGLFYCLLISVVLISFNDGWVGNPALTLLAVILGSLFLVVVGLLMGGLFRNTHQVNTWSTLVLLVFFIPGVTSIVALPKSLDFIFRLIPTRYISDALTLSMAGNPYPSQLWTDLAILAVSTVVVFAAVVLALRREKR